MPEREEPMKHLNVMVPASEHKAIRQKALDHDITISEAIRFALADDEVWRRAAKAKAKKSN